MSSWTMPFRLFPAVLPGLCLLAGLTACTTGKQPLPGQAPASVPAARAEGTYEERFQALEAGLQLLAARLDALQEAPGYARAGTSMADARLDQLPAEATPIKPGIVLAAKTERKAPSLPPPAAAPVPVRKAPLPSPAAAPVPVRKAPLPSPAAAPVPAREIVAPDTPAVPQRRSREDGWVINLASYNSESFAARKRAEFVEEGVAAEQVQARVNGNTVYRLRVSGFESFRDASAEAETIEALLGLEGTWIARH
ncbi:MAG: SPOR domain-containing protein [Gammaproteobacteria bacterium]|nr:SPOR domain-containing protein [Gammaproteobacteria bacterium]